MAELDNQYLRYRAIIYKKLRSGGAELDICTVAKILNESDFIQYVHLRMGMKHRSDTTQDIITSMYYLASKGYIDAIKEVFSIYPPSKWTAKERACSYIDNMIRPAIGHRRFDVANYLLSMIDEVRSDDPKIWKTLGARSPITYVYDAGIERIDPINDPVERWLRDIGFIIVYYGFKGMLQESDVATPSFRCVMMFLGFRCPWDITRGFPTQYNDLQLTQLEFYIKTSRYLPNNPQKEHWPAMVLLLKKRPEIFASRAGALLSLYCSMKSSYFNGLVYRGIYVEFPDEIFAILLEVSLLYSSGIHT